MAAAVSPQRTSTLWRALATQTLVWSGSTNIASVLSSIAAGTVRVSRRPIAAVADGGLPGGADDYATRLLPDLKNKGKSNIKICRSGTCLLPWHLRHGGEEIRQRRDWLVKTRLDYPTRALPRRYQNTTALRALGRWPRRLSSVTDRTLRPSGSLCFPRSLSSLSLDLHLKPQVAHANSPSRPSSGGYPP